MQSNHIALSDNCQLSLPVGSFILLTKPKAGTGVRVATGSDKRQLSLKMSLYIYIITTLLVSALRLVDKEISNEIHFDSL